MPKLIKSLKAKGISTDKMIQKSKLNNYNLTDPSGFIPSMLLYDFLEQVQHSQGLYSIAGEFHKDFSLRGAGSFGDGLFIQPTLLQTVQGAVKFQHLLRTDNILDFEIKGNTISFSFKMLSEPSIKKTIIEDIGLSQVLDTFRYVGGDQWFPTEIHTTSKSVMRLDKLLGPGNFKLYCNQPVNKVVFPLEFALKELIPYSKPENFILDSDNNLSKQITRILHNTSPGVQLNFKQIAEYSNMSTRSLSRRLTEEGATFNQLASNVMLSKATRLLTTTNDSIKEIAQHLGYSKSTNFVRAFKVSSQLTPELFRAQC
ncbi:MAG: hypothetical protein BM564_11420 [Bacteroidetes bacterium MedPE-SWsnd-G2]|nr:MAG: hypothetical protein BM564_11420 [Bacteroidetes bacterium MedPE-SWsnd-G2]